MKIKNKKILSIVIILFFLGAAVFGAALINHNMNHSDCIVVASTGTTCPSDQIQFFIHHLVTTQVFSTAEMVPTFSMLFFLALFLSIIFLLFIYKILFLFLFSSFQYLNQQVRLKSSIQNFFSWLSLLEHSPTFSS